ncbi:MmcQ/YjbR family DNA-binding protein [Spiroplasma sp. BIUS-1]|uniref:MmcQ/YjbR family DNA-binding protein n=1 Tax=Spiroplasma sp. BIUS-1 TaxID=216964 RepID=UPI00139922B9|nr:MmcQ/YjbR family DNA-binding protein [Spiroplasma sp. BIUS-1]QHX36571.1 hypothetical protein SBIUS_v1c03180 [Spiroplasma sp. BIUS-1]
MSFNEIFTNKVINKNKLIEFGFVFSNNNFTYECSIFNDNFLLNVFVDLNNKVNFKLFEKDTKEEYDLVHVKNANGDFVSNLKKLCSEKLLEISNKCFDIEIYSNIQTKNIIEYMDQKYSIKPNFLWEKHPKYSVFKNKKNDKWFALIMEINLSKIGFKENEIEEILVIKDLPENVANKIEQNNYYPAYHMNKSNWYTVILNNSLSNNVLYNLIDTSYELVK